jgi:hypothetical protein
VAWPWRAADVHALISLEARMESGVGRDRTCSAVVVVALVGLIRKR